MVNKESQSEEIRRPWLMTIVCILGFLFCIWLLFFIIAASLFANGLTHDGQIMMFVFCLLFISHVLIFISYWNMQKWGIYVYGLGLLGVLIGSFKLGGHFEIRDLMMPFFIIGIGLFYYKRMR